jgi:Cu-Zn family superoxide dismutase
MPNQFAGSDGTLRTHVVNPIVTLSDGPASLFDADGSALVVHAGPDDYRSQPAGNAGDRIACAVIEKH